MKCAHCNAEFEPQRLPAKFCSGKCRVAAHRVGKAVQAKPKRKARAQASGAIDRKATDAELARLRGLYRAEVDANVAAVVGEREAALNEKEQRLNEWSEALTAQQADITVYMTEQEFKVVLGCLHPDRAGNDEALRKRLNRAFDIFKKLEVYIRRYPISVLRERGWA